MVTENHEMPVVLDSLKPSPFDLEIIRVPTDQPFHVADLAFHPASARASFEENKWITQSSGVK